MKCDIKVTKFILDNYKNYKFFLTNNHPTIIVFIHICNQILMILNNVYKFVPFHIIEDFSLGGLLVHSKYDKLFNNFN
jgi:hypothetical protein